MYSQQNPTSFIDNLPYDHVVVTTNSFLLEQNSRNHFLIGSPSFIPTLSQYDRIYIAR